MNLPRKHIRETKKLVKALKKREVAQWLLEQGYYPEQYVLPPCFSVDKFTFKSKPYFDFAKKNSIPIEELVEVSFPKTSLTERTFGLIQHKLYHDIVWHMINKWDEVIKTLFNPNNLIYSYSFPIPVDNLNVGAISRLRAGRMIYEFIEMAENDIVSEAHRFKFIVRSDIKNFYPSLYTHSIAWALHSKVDARKDRWEFNLLGTKLDKLFQNSNDGCTNGIAIGPAVSDLVTEVYLAAVDLKTSKALKEANIPFAAVRFKDDYRFLCESSDDAHEALKILQRILKKYNLKLSEEKSDLEKLPEGLFRQWTSEYQPYSLRRRQSIKYKNFENTYRAVLRVDEKYPGTGAIDKFLSELTSKRYNLKLKLQPKEVYKVFSLILMLKERRAKALPQVLAICESLMDEFAKEKATVKAIYKSLNEIAERKFTNQSSNEYDLIWLTYFLKSHGQLTAKWPRKLESILLKSIKSNKQKFDTQTKFCRLFKKIESKGKNPPLLPYLAIFPIEDED